MASIQARHMRTCPRYGKSGWTPFAEARKHCGCPSGPRYFVAVREGQKIHREYVGRDRKVAEQALRKLAVQVDEGEYRPQANISFAAWADRWLASLERKLNTRRGYASTMHYAKSVLGGRIVRRLGPADIAAFNEHLRELGISASTRSKHLRVLGACLNSAVQHGYGARNPVREIPKAEKPRAEKKEAAYFENDELPRLFAALPGGLFRTLFEVALKTGMRQGELSAVTWGDIDLGEGITRVRRSRTDGVVSSPKNHEQRDVDLTADVVAVLGSWWGACGRPSDQELVFAGETLSGYLDTKIALRVLYGAMETAGIPRVGPTGENRTFHSFRHTFAKRALESGRQITWLSRHLGHSSLAVTTGVYGHWERAERKREAALMEGVFGI